jgi:hypothetical protein
MRAVLVVLVIASALALNACASRKIVARNCELAKDGKTWVCEDL